MLYGRKQNLEILAMPTTLTTSKLSSLSTNTITYKYVRGKCVEKSDTVRNMKSIIIIMKFFIE